MLVKRAQAEGVDLAELEIYINSILQRREHEANQKKEEKERKLYDEWTLYNELNGVTLTAAEKKIVEAVKDPNEQNKLRKTMLTEKKISIISTYPVPNTKENLLELLSISVSAANKKLSFLEQKKNVSILVLLAGIVLPIAGWIAGAIVLREMHFLEEKLVKAWRAKCEQILLKGRSLRGDAEFTQQLIYFESLLKKK